MLSINLDYNSEHTSCHVAGVNWSFTKRPNITIPFSNPTRVFTFLFSELFCFRLLLILGSSFLMMSQISESLSGNYKL